MYLQQDVKAQRQLYLKSCEAVWEQDKLNLCDFISMAQMANAISTLYIPAGRLHKVKVEDEPAFRQAYYGGRLVMTHTSWMSEQLIDVELCLEEDLAALWPSITSYLCYYDANSLYPAQMIKQPIACGLMRKIMVDALITSETIIERMNQETRLDKPGLWSSRLLQVDVTCPTDIYIPFLMRRDAKGNNEQHLLPILKQWYAGPELIEAILVGYTITKVYAFYTFTHYEPLYEQFIRTNYEARKKHPSGALNLLPKFKMNSLSGKGAQKALEEQEVIYIGEKEMYAPRTKNVTETRAIFANEYEDEVLACFAKEQRLVAMTPFCLNATVWILAWSRVHMSRFTRSIDGYRNPKHVPVYGDTDSLFITHETELKAPAGSFGKELGQFKNEMPFAKIVYVIVMAPKTTMKMFVATKYKRNGKPGPHPTSHPEGRRIKDERGQPILLHGQYEYMCQVTCKGIPHYSKPYRCHEQYKVSHEKKMEITQVLSTITLRARFKPHKEKNYFDTVHLKDRYHVFEQPGKPPEVYSVFTPATFKLVAEGKASFTTVFGMMERNLQKTNMEKMGIRLDYNKRGLSVNPYWKKGKRQVDNSVFLTKPLGFQ